MAAATIAHKRVAAAIQQDPNSQLMAACCRTKENLSRFCERFEIGRAYSKHSELLNDPDLDAVYLATPVDMHQPHTIEAASAGKHVLVEKPMALDVDQCQSMIDACQQHDVKLGVAYYRRFYPTIDRLRELLSTNKLGTPLAVFAATGARFAIQPDEAGYWRVKKGKGGGGAIMDVGSHRIDLLLDLFGDVRNVRGYCDTKVGSWDAEDCATVLCQFENGVQATVQCFFGTRVPIDSFELIGSHGRVIIKTLNGPQIEWTTAEGSQVEYLPPDDNLHAPLIRDFSLAIVEDRRPRCDGQDGLRTNEIIARAYRSAKDQQAIG